jgi:hypothetical protein
MDPYAPHPQPKKHNPWKVGCLILVGLAVLAIVAFGGCAALFAHSAKVVTKKTSPASVAPAASGSSKPGAAGLEAKYHGTCDIDLGSLNGSDYSLTSEVTVENTGSVDAKVLVLVSWPQYGHDPVGDGKVVQVAKGQTMIVRFAKHATQSQISRVQDYQLKHDGELVCQYKAMVNTA